MIVNKIKLFPLIVCLFKTSTTIVNTKFNRRFLTNNRLIHLNYNNYQSNNQACSSKHSYNDFNLNILYDLNNLSTSCVNKFVSSNIIASNRLLNRIYKNYALQSSFNRFNNYYILKGNKRLNFSGISDVLTINTWNLGSKSPSTLNYISSFVNNFRLNQTLSPTFNILKRSYGSSINLKTSSGNFSEEKSDNLKSLSANLNIRPLNDNNLTGIDKNMDHLFNKALGGRRDSHMGSKGRLVLSYFKNRQGLRIRTYASEVERARGKIVLVHGIKSHFRGDFAGYNVDWYFQHLGEYATESAHQTANLEKALVFQKTPVSHSLSDNYATIDGKNIFDITPRFKFEGSFIEFLNNLGYSVYGFDHQGHGLSESFKGRRCFFDKFDDLCYDLIQFISLVKRGNFFDTSQEYDENVLFNTQENITTSSLYTGNGFSTSVSKCYLMGLSMGGNVVLRAMQIYNMKTSKKLVDALVCMAGMINIDYHYKGFAKTCFPCFRFLSKLRPVFKVGKPTDFSETLTMHMRGQDPVYFCDRLYLKMALMIYDATKTLERDFNHYPDSLPTLFIHSTDDTMTDVRGPRHLMDKYFKHSDIAKLHELDGAAHVVSSPLLTTVTGPLVQKFLEDLESKS